MDLINPISHRGTIVTEPSQFIGRKKEVSRIQRRVLEGKKHSNLAIIADKRTGGSSLAYHAIFDKREELKKKKIATVWIDLGLFDSPKSFFLQILQELYQATRRLDSEGILDEVYHTLPLSESITLDEIRNSIQNYAKQLVFLNIKAICILDEFDQAAELFKGNPHHFQFLRTLGTYPGYRLSLVVVAHKPLGSIEIKYGQTAASSLEGIFEDIIQLKPFNKKELSEYYTEFLAALPLQPEHIEKINSYCNGNPYLMNLLCYEVFENYFEEEKVDIRSAYNKVKDRLTTKAVKDVNLTLYKQIKSGIIELIQWIGGDEEIAEVSALTSLKNDPCFEALSHHLDISKEELNRLVETIDQSLSKPNRNDSTTPKIPDEFTAKLQKKIATFQENRERILLKQRTAIEKMTSLPMALKTVVIQNYYDLLDVRLELSQNAPWIFLTGENGFGKTLLLQAIAIALNGRQVEWGGGNLAPEKFNAGVELFENRSVRLHNFSNPFFKPFKSFAAYGPSRLSVQQLGTREELIAKSARTYSLFNADGVLLNIEKTLLDLHKLSNEQSPEQKNASNQLKIFKDTLLKLLSPYIEEIDTTGTEVQYRESGGDNKRLFGQLASGIRSIIAMTGDILIRLADENREIQKTEDLKGIVIIDEMDLHLHPKWQKELPTRLSTIFPNVQFIASTHSPIPLLGSPKNALFLRVRKNDQNRIEVDNLEISDINRFQPNIILSSPIFGMEDIFHIGRENIDEVKTEDTWAEMKRSEETKAFLMKKLRERKKQFQPDSKK